MFKSILLFTGTSLMLSSPALAQKITNTNMPTQEKAERIHVVLGEESVALSSSGHSLSKLKIDCNDIENAFANFHKRKKYNLVCETADDSQTARLKQGALASSIFADDTQILIYQDREGNAQIHTRFLSKEHESDLDNGNWSINSADASDMRQAVLLRLKNISDYRQDILSLKQFSLLVALDESQRLKLEPQGFVDQESQKTISFSEAYRIFEEENTRQKHYLRAVLENLLALGVSTVNYYSVPASKNTNAVDWQYTTDDLYERFTTLHHWQFDDNFFRTNTGHIGAGLYYYLIARRNNLSPIESLLVSIGSSTIWEMASEHREVVSINDQVITGIGGFILGEPVNQMMEEINKSWAAGLREDFLNIFPDNLSITNWLRKHLPKGHLDPNTGFDINAFRKVAIGMAVERLKTSKGTSRSRTVFLDSEIVNIPQFENPGVVSARVGNVPYSRLSVKNSTSSNGEVSELHFIAQVALAGYFNKNIQKTVDDKLYGYSFFVGLSHEVDFQERESQDPTVRTEEIAMVKVLGSNMQVIAYMGKVKIRMIIDIYGHFAMIRPIAIESYRATHDTSGLSSVERHHDYVYAFGSSADARLSAEYKGLTVEGEITDDRFNQTVNRNRFSDQITNFDHAHDERLRAKITAGLKLGKRCALKVSREDVVRSGSIGNVKAKTKETKYSIAISYDLARKR